MYAGEHTFIFTAATPIVFSPPVVRVHSAGIELESDSRVSSAIHLDLHITGGRDVGSAQKDEETKDFGRVFHIA